MLLLAVFNDTDPNLIHVLFVVYGLLIFFVFFLRRFTAVFTPALHAKGPRFEPQRNPNLCGASHPKRQPVAAVKLQSNYY